MITPSSRPPLRRPPDTVDLAVVGAGAAGIAAARYGLAAGLSVAVLEARDRVGGRAVTGMFGGHPVDLGPHWLHAGSLNPLVRLGMERGEPLRRAPRRGHLIVNGRFGSRSEREANARAFDRTDAAIVIAARGERDPAVSEVLPPLGPWRRSTAATFALVSGRPLHEVSAKDFPSEEFGDNYFVRGGYGAFLGRLAAGLPVALGSPVRAIDWSGAGVRLETPRGTIGARCAILTVPAPVLAAGSVRFTPKLPDETADAISGFLGGTYEHVVLNWADPPFRGDDRLTKLLTRRHSLGMMTWMDGAPFHYVELDHEAVARFGRESAAGVARHAREVLRDSFGLRALRELRVLAVTDWRSDPWAWSSWSVVPPGLVHIRDAVSRPVGDRLWFAGEANSRAMWGTVGGAWEEGERAACEVADALRREKP